MNGNDNKRVKNYNIILYIKYVKYNKYTNPIDFRKSTIIKEAGKTVWCENVKRAKNFRNLGAFRFSDMLERD